MLKRYTITRPDYTVSYNYIPLTVTEEQLKLAKEFAPLFAQKRAQVYARRGQGDVKNIADQAYTSKISEFMVYNHLRETKPDADITPPSCEIYDIPSFDDDLVLTENGKTVKIHVKSHDTRRVWKTRPLSWGFQKEDPIFKHKANDIMVLVAYVHETCGQLVSKNYVYKYESFLAPAMSKNLASKEFVYYSPEINL